MSSDSSEDDDDIPLAELVEQEPQQLRRSRRERVLTERAAALDAAAAAPSLGPQEPPSRQEKKVFDRLRVDGQQIPLPPPEVIWKWEPSNHNGSTRGGYCFVPVCYKEETGTTVEDAWDLPMTLINNRWSTSNDWNLSSRIYLTQLLGDVTQLLGHSCLKRFPVTKIIFLR
uniref:Uncharacterized protein n=1 Tax=Grammatophora oceanica TaxID=210454 RepID=A0A7S1V5F7_9STRA